jgi:hypothetical protein
LLEFCGLFPSITNSAYVRGVRRLDKCFCTTFSSPHCYPSKVLCRPQ